MALPLSRNTTYAAGAQVKSLDLNAIQDAIVAGQHGLITKQSGGASGQSFDITIWNFVSSGATWASLAGGAGHVAFPIDLPVGAELKEVRSYVRDSAGATMTSKLMKTTKSNTNSQIGSTQTSAGGGAPANQTLTHASLTEVVAAGAFYYVIITPSDINQLAFGIEYDFTVP